MVTPFRPAVTTGRGTNRWFFFTMLGLVVTTAVGVDPYHRPLPVSALAPRA